MRFLKVIIWLAGCGIVVKIGAGKGSVFFCKQILQVTNNLLSILAKI